MRAKKLFILLFFLFLPSVHALTVSPDPVLTACPFTLNEMVWYDVCATPVDDAVVYYNISFGVADPLTVDYPLTQTLDNIGSGIYSKDLTAEWIQGTYTASVKATRVDYEDIYDSKTFTVSPDYPYPMNFSYAAHLDYFNIWWKGKYQDGSCFPDRELAVECFLNDRYDRPALPFPFKITPDKEGTCAVAGARDIYNFTKDLTVSYAASVLNTISCKFYDPAHPWIFSWTNRTFRPIAFESTVPPTVSITTGKPFSLVMHVKNLGLLTDNYTVELIPNTPSVVSIEDSFSVISGVKTNSIGDAYTKITMLAAVSTTITINVTSLTSCQYSSACISKIITLTIQGGVNSLPDFDAFAIIQIVAVAAIILALVNLKKVKTHP